MLSWATKIGRIRDIYSPDPCCVGACAYSRPALEPERDKTGIPAAAGGRSVEGSNIGTVPTRSGRLATVRRADIRTSEGRGWKLRNTTAIFAESAACLP